MGDPDGPKNSLKSCCLRFEKLQYLGEIIEPFLVTTKIKFIG